jgi:hypothetical protein
MADLKISQLPAAAALTGSELIELVQSGNNVQSTAGAIASSASPTTTLANQGIWWTTFPSIAGGLAGVSNVGTGGGSPSWVPNVSAVNQAANNAGATIAAATQMGTFTSAAGANSAADIVSSGPAVNMIRAFSNGLPIAGFSMTLFFAFTTTVSTEQCFFGYSPGSGNLSGSQVPSALTNMIGLGRDSGDTNLQFMINNGSGSAAKTDLGVTLASLANKMLKLVITCDSVGNCAISLTNIESGGGLVSSVSYPTATAKLPVAGATAQVGPRMHVNNGGTASAVAFGIAQSYFTAGFAGL